MRDQRRNWTVSPFQIMVGIFMLVALAVLHPDFLRDAYSSFSENGTGGTLSMFIAVYCAFSIYQRVNAAQRRAKTAGTVGLRLSADEKLGWSAGMGWVVVEVSTISVQTYLGTHPFSITFLSGGADSPARPTERLPGTGIVRWRWAGGGSRGWGRSHGG